MATGTSATCAPCGAGIRESSFRGILTKTGSDTDSKFGAEPVASPLDCGFDTPAVWAHQSTWDWLGSMPPIWCPKVSILQDGAAFSRNPLATLLLQVAVALVWHGHAIIIVGRLPAPISGHTDLDLQLDVVIELVLGLGLAACFERAFFEFIVGVPPSRVVQPSDAPW